MNLGPRARRAAGALLVCALGAPTLADGGAAASSEPAAQPRPLPGGTPGATPAAARPGSAQPGASQRRPPPMVLVVPLGFGVLLPLTLPTTMPHARAAAAASPTEPGPEAAGASGAAPAAPSSRAEGPGGAGVKPSEAR